MEAHMLHGKGHNRGLGESVSVLWIAVLVLLTVLTITIPAGDASAASATLNWSAPTTHTDGTALTDLAGYKLYFGTASATYSAPIDVGNVLTYTVTGLTGGTYYFAVTAYDSSGNESSFSNEVVRTVANEVTNYTITASAGTGGSISPSGSTTVSSGSSQSYTITPATGYTISGVTVDGVSAGAVSSYSFSNVTANHTISATFSAVQVTTYTITASAGTGGSITPSGSTTVSSGSSQAYTITPATGYTISAVTVDGVSAGAVSSYSFSNVTANHTISATFSAVTYTITASAGTGGSISPSGSSAVTYGGSRTFTITPATGYTVAGVTVDGVSVGAVSSYSFSSVTANHTISATFSVQSADLTITATAATGGSITPAGSTTVSSGGKQTYTITPATGYSISDVLIDGVSFGAVASYTFNNVTASHTISATFAAVNGSSSTVVFMPTADTYINVDANNYSTSEQLNAYTWPTGYAANAMLMKFDFSGIPEGVTIVSATLHLYLMESDTNTSYTGYNLSLHRIVNFNPDLSLATGYTYDGTNSWTANAKAYNNIPLAQADISAAYDTKAVNQTAGFKTWDATQLIKDWHAAPAANYGLMVNSDALAPSDTYRVFASSKNTTTDYIPYLEVVYSSAAATHTITASAGTGGSITPSGETEVSSSGSQTYTITPSSGYVISDVLVDGVSAGVVSSYTFSDVTADHTISAVFKKAVSYTITASGARGGSISPSGKVSVTGGSSKTYTITPATRYKIAQVTVDGVSVGAVSSYTFTNVSKSHTITATFKRF
jgi:hypothetical protein